MWNINVLFLFIWSYLMLDNVNEFYFIHIYIVQSVPKTFWQTSPNSILEEFLYLIKQILCDVYLPEPIFTRLGHRAGGLWRRLIVKHYCFVPFISIHFVIFLVYYWIDWLIDFWCLTPLSAIFQLYHGDQF